MEKSRYRGIPQFIYGTAFKGDQTGLLTEKALTHGFTGIDSATGRNYNEKLVGEGIRKALEKLEVKREELFYGKIQTKFSPYQEGKDPRAFPYDTTANLETQVDQSITSSLKHLHTGEDTKTAYLDNLTLHTPYPTIEETLRFWKAVEKYVPQQISTLGISDVHLSTLTELYEKATIKPVLVQNRLTADIDQSLPPFTPQTPYDADVRRFCEERQIVYQPWGVLWGTCLPDTTQTLVKSEVVSAVAREIDVILEMAVYLLVMGLDPGNISVLNGTKNEERMKAAFDGLRKFKDWLDGDGNFTIWTQYMNGFRKVLGDEEIL